MFYLEPDRGLKLRWKQKHQFGKKALNSASFIYKKTMWMGEAEGGPDLRDGGEESQTSELNSCISNFPSFISRESRAS